MRVFINGNRLFDHMMVGSYLRCWNYYFFKYVIGLSDSEFPEALVMGIMFHSALAIWYSTHSIAKAEEEFMSECAKYKYFENAPNASKQGHYRSIDNALEKLRMYCDIFNNDYFKPINSEVEHFVPLEALKRYGIFAGKNNCGDTYIVKGTPIWYVGHIDCVGKVSDKLTFLEHKTTGLYEGSSLLESYTFSLQVKGYTLCIMDLYGLKEPCSGYVDIIFLRAKSRENATLRYPLIFDMNQINKFKNDLSFVIGEILWKEKTLKEWSIPDPSKCTAFGKICEFQKECDLLPNMKLCHESLLRRGFVPTLAARLDKIEKEPDNGKLNGKLYYTVEEGVHI
jgi:hypothetical protein